MPSQGQPLYTPYHPTHHQQSPHQRPSELQGTPPGSQSPRPQYANTQQFPPYQPNQQENKPSVHFAPSPAPTPPQHRPSLVNSASPTQGSYLQVPPHHSSHTQNPHAAVQAPHMRPYMNGNQSQYSLDHGYSSDPESRRRRRHKNRDDNGSAREVERPRKTRSRSTNTEGFIGAAGGGLIGDLIFPGLGTVGGALAGWIGGKDYGKHRKYREDKLSREQEEWEHKFGRTRRDSDEKRHRHHTDHHGGHRRHHSDY